MNSPWFRAGAVAAGILLSAPAWALGGRGAPEPAPLGEAARKTWGPVLEEGAREGGLPSGPLEHAVAHLAQAGFTPETARTSLETALEAARRGLPAEPVLAKIAEGALKGASAGDLAQAGRARLEALVRARDLLVEAGHADGADRGRGLLVATALALESGMPPEPLGAVLARGAGLPPGQVMAVVEAGEALHLEGLDTQTVQELMVDCLDRHLRRPEILRLVSFAREQHRRGLDGPAVRAALWGGRGGAGSPGPGPAGPGSGGAPGAGGGAPGRGTGPGGGF
ncbi:MAG: hypothetical protein AB1578_22635, partial [Thermodesulfobacteriota bacterium]